MNTWAWVAWLVAALALTSAGRNPLYLVLIWLALQMVFAFWMDGGRESLALFSPIRLTLLIMTTSAIFNALTSHFGETILFILPGNLPLISGPVTLEALVYGAINGLVLGNILTAFMVLNLALPTQALIRLIPRTYYSLAVVISIAVAFLPSAGCQLQLVREAQAIRGRRVTGIRDYLGLFMPVLVGGMEHAVQLAETMTARGFVGVEPQGHAGRQRLALLAGLLLILAGLIASGDVRWGPVGILMLSAGFLIIGVELWIAGRQSPRSSYRIESWSWLDILLVSYASLCLLLSFQLIPGLDYSSLYYNPYPAISLPTFNPWYGLVILGLLFSILARHRGVNDYA